MKSCIKDYKVSDGDLTKDLLYYLWMCELKKWLIENHNLNIKIDDFIDDVTGVEWDFEISIVGTDIDKNGNYTPLIPYSVDDPNRKFKTY